MARKKGGGGFRRARAGAGGRLFPPRSLSRSLWIRLDSTPSAPDSPVARLQTLDRDGSRGLKHDVAPCCSVALRQGNGARGDEIGLARSHHGPGDGLEGVLPVARQNARDSASHGHLCCPYRPVRLDRGPRSTRRRSQCPWTSSASNVWTQIVWTNRSVRDSQAGKSTR